MILLRSLSRLAVVALLLSEVAQARNSLPQESDSYYRSGQADLAAKLAIKPKTGRAKNVILFVGDGMGISTITAARILAGQRRGVDGESASLNLDRLPYAALVKTYSHDTQVTDSAASATALLTGVKVGNDTIGLRQGARYDDCRSAKGAEAATLFEIAEAAGLATGIVSTARLTHATPAAAYAHTPNRDWEHDAAMSADARALGCTDIAQQLIEWPAGNGFEVMLGGGRERFLPTKGTRTVNDEAGGLRSDGRNLIAEWQRDQGRRYVSDRAALEALDPSRTRQLLGLFAPDHMDYEDNRISSSSSQPSLTEMTAAAIELLSRRKNGYVLLVEGGRIDHAHHAGNAGRALNETLAFDAAIAMALQTVDLADTLVIVTADHSHTMTISGYPKRGNPILGKVVDVDGRTSLGADRKPYTTLSYATGPGGEVGERSNPASKDTEATDYIQSALVPAPSATHGGEDVALRSTGPSAHLFQGTIEQNLVFHLIRHAMALP